MLHYLYIHLCLYCLLTLSCSGALCPTNCSQCEEGVCTGCNSGWYGEDCSQSCSQCPDGCTQNSGTCLCPQGTWGTSCDQKCSPECGPIGCDSVNGHCQGCKAGYNGVKCSRKCGHCVGDVCEQGTGECPDGCTEGWTGLTCDTSCIDKCLRCSDDSKCLECSPGYPEPYCSLGYRSISEPLIRSTHAEHTGSNWPSKQFVDGAVGVSFGVLILLIIAFVIIMTKRPKCFPCFREAPKSPPMYVLRRSGSLQASREFLDDIYEDQET